MSLIGVIGMSEGARARVARLMLTVMLVSMAAAVALLAGCGQRAGDRAGEDAANGAAAGEPVKIGAVLSLSGSLSGLGIPARQAIEVEVERINGEGGVNGRLVEVVFEDDASDEAKAVAATTRLIEQEDVLAVIGGG
ncbi:MAG: ABC transporter substrate-binding protein, partial [Clostridiales bacterium]|nr:ABC transporter substrate-binding protein [Clostridiales bacterium]